jgi:hypothetical protein
VSLFVLPASAKLGVPPGLVAREQVGLPVRCVASGDSLSWALRLVLVSWGYGTGGLLCTWGCVAGISGLALPLVCLFVPTPIPFDEIYGSWDLICLDYLFATSSVFFLRSSTSCCCCCCSSSCS